METVANPKDNETMSETNQDPTVETEQDNDLVKKLRQEIRERDARLKEVETAKSQLERRQTFQELGINPTEGTGALFFKAYDGELDPESIRAEASKYGILEDNEQAQQVQQQKSAEASQHEKMNAASAGAVPVAESPDPSRVAQERFDEVYAKTGNREEAMAQFFGAKLAQTMENKKSG